MSIRILTVTVVLFLAGFLAAQEPPPEPWPLSKLEFGRPVQVAKFSTQYSCSVFPASLEFLGDAVHLVYLADRRTEAPKLLYQKSPDGGRTWEKAVLLDQASMANVCRDGDTLWIIASAGDTGGFRRYGTEVHLIKLDLKTGRAEAPRTIFGTPRAAEDSSYGMVTIVVHGSQMAAAVMRDHRTQPEGAPVEHPLEPVLLTSSDAGVTWQEHAMSDTDFTGNASVACWPLSLPGGPAAIFGAGNLSLARLDPQNRLQNKFLALPASDAKTVEPFRLSDADGQLFLVFAEVLANETARLFLTTSADAVTWTHPVALANPIPYELITPLSSLTVAGPNVLFGCTVSKGGQSWLSGDMSARILLSRDGAKTFERIDLGAMFRYGTTFPVLASDLEGKKLGCVVVALVPKAEAPPDEEEPAPQGFEGEACLLFLSSPALAPPAPSDAAFARRVEDLIGKLGAADYQERERATAELQTLGEAAIPFLEKALQNPDMEVSTRARLILRQAYPEWLKPLPHKTDAP